MNVIHPQKFKTLSSTQIEVIKWIAIISMTFDHFHHIVLNDGEYLEILTHIGRLAFPLFAFLIAYNLQNSTKRTSSYVINLLLLGITTQGVHNTTISMNEPAVLNMGFTFALGILTIFLYERAFYKKETLSFLLFMGILGLCIALPIEYGVIGVLLTLSFWLFLKDIRYAIAIIVLLFSINSPIATFFSLLSLCLIFTATRINIKINRTPKFFFYAFYPVHLAILGLIKAIT